MNKRICIKAFLALILASFNLARVVAVPMVAAPVKLAWEASPDVAVRGYALYYRSTDSLAVNRIDVGAALSVTLSGLEAGSDYVIFVVAYDAAGIESPSSNQLQYNPPALSRLQIGEQTDGAMNITFRAAAGALCRVEYSSTLVSPQWQTLGNVTADANGNVMISDAAPGLPAMRFYRGMRLLAPEPKF